MLTSCVCVQSTCDVEWLLEEAAHTAARRDWRRMGVVSESVAYGFLVASYRRRMGLVAVREMARHRYRQSQFVGLTRLQLDEIGRERQVQRQGAQRAEARAELSVELAQARILPAYELACRSEGGLRLLVACVCAGWLLAGAERDGATHGRTDGRNTDRSAEGERASESSPCVRTVHTSQSKTWRNFVRI